MKLAEDKTKITHILEGFDFVGFNFRRYESRKSVIHLVKPSNNSIKSFKSKVAEICKACHGHNVDVLIDRLNPLIRGTTYYWKPSSASKIFSKMDNYIWQKVFKFIKRLHPNKSIKWLIKTYFPIYKENNRINKWILTGPKKGKHLIKMVWTPIKRHEMIKFNHTPYDKFKEEYFNNRNLSS